MKKIIKTILNHFDFDIQRVSCLEKSNDPINVLELLFTRMGLKTIIDGGASIGTISKRFSESFPTAKIHAFEPYQPHFDVLQEITSIYKHIIPLNKGLCDMNGKCSFFLNQESGTNSTLRANKKGQNIYGDQLKEIGQTEIECISLDSYLQQNNIDSVDVLKLDLQGGEVDALKGAANSLASGKIKCILIEVMFENHYIDQPSAGRLLHDLIEEYGFSLFNLFDLHHHCGRLIYADAIFILPETLDSVKKRLPNLFHQYSKLLIDLK
jgi:FkbM family methyltransferase